jgi:hypothetical protein
MNTIPNQPTQPPKAVPKGPRVDEEAHIVTRGRVSHVEFAVDQPLPMPVQTPKPKKPVSG